MWKFKNLFGSERLTNLLPEIWLTLVNVSLKKQGIQATTFKSNKKDTSLKSVVEVLASWKKERKKLKS